MSELKKNHEPTNINNNVFKEKLMLKNVKISKPLIFLVFLNPKERAKKKFEDILVL